jgi:hypothetical protein
MTTKGWLAKTGGVALVAIGLGGFALGLFTNVHINGSKPIALMLAGGQAMIMGTLLYCYHELLIRSTCNEQALSFQYDIGYEAGWRECERSTRPTVVDIEEFRRALSHN